MVGAAPALTTVVATPGTGPSAADSSVLAISTSGASRMIAARSASAPNRVTRSTDETSMLVSAPVSRAARNSVRTAVAGPGVARA
ncbi:unannotated protein [freshwater metagenome]|uniref:Unannotated protein n=1 Tax=freshwater metagenome TaxID=449393 RepID=A0A6J7HV81_9ZZZZ